MRGLKIVLKVVAALITLFLVLFTCLGLYVIYNKDVIYKRITEQVNERINGTVIIGDIQTNFTREFPAISLSLKDVTVRDSLWNLHHHDLLQARRVFLAMNALSIWHGDARISQIHIDDARIYLFTDSVGYSNTDILRIPGDTSAKKNKNLLKINHLKITNADFVFEHVLRSKYFHFEIRKMNTRWHYNTIGWEANTYLYTGIDKMTFNTGKGSFLEHTTLQTKLDLSYNAEKKVLAIPRQQIKVDKDKYDIAFTLLMAEKPNSYTLKIWADQLAYKKAIFLLTPSIYTKLEKINFAQPIDVNATLNGGTSFSDTPTVVVQLSVKDNTLTVPGYKFEHCSFNGILSNEAITGGGHSATNTSVTLASLKGRWADINFSTPKLAIIDLKDPYADVNMNLQLTTAKLNELTGDNFQITAGKVSANVRYKGRLKKIDSTFSQVNGKLTINNATLTYVPRGLTFYNTNATVRLEGKDLKIDDVRLQVDSTKLSVQGSLQNFRTLLFSKPEKIVIDWKIKSDHIDLAHFITLLSGRKEGNQRDSTKKITTSKVAAQIDKMLNDGKARLKLDVGRVTYRKFEATDIRTNITLDQSIVRISDLYLSHAGGVLNVNAQILQLGKLNNFTLKSTATRVDVKKFFNAFENFGQDAVTADHIDGKLSSEFDVAGSIRENGTMVPRSINGTVSFKLQQATLVDFEPIKRIGEFAFRRRKLDSIVVREIDNKFRVSSGVVYINPLYLESNVMNMRIEGAYVVGRPGTDINIDIPLRNPRKDELIENDEIRHRKSMKGIVLHLKASNDDDGKVRLKWNLANRPPVMDFGKPN
jgi:hypothetical protein